MTGGTQRAVVHADLGRVEVRDVEVPALGADRVRVEVSHCGICGTDIHMIMDGWGQPGRVPGHEYTGTIAEVGADVDGWEVGDRVVYVPGPGCDECRFCQAKRPSLCERRDAAGGGESPPGGFGQTTVVDPRHLTRVPDGLSLYEAALAEPLAVAVHGVGRTTVEPGDRVLVSGAGPIGALATAVLIDRGVTDVVVSEPSPVRRELAERLGATVVTPDGLPDASKLHPGVVVDEPFDVVFECSGVRAAQEASLGQLQRGGTLVLLGNGIDPPRFDANRILLNELWVTGGFEYDADGIDTALDLLASGRLPTDLLIEAAIEPTATQQALDDLKAGRIAGKVMISLEAFS